jgi:hypothetical protein
MTDHDRPLSPTGTPLCKANTNTGQPCRRTALKRPDGSYADFCRDHGGAQPYAMPAPFETGVGLPAARRYMRKLPQHMIQDYNDLLNDTDIMRLEDDIVLLDLRMGQLLSRLPDDETAFSAAIVQIREAYQRILHGVAKHEQFESQQGLDDLAHALEGPEAEKEAWEEIQLLMDQRARLIRLQMQREKTLQKFIPIDKLMALVKYLVDIITQHANAEIGDADDARRFLEAVQNDIKRIL